ncbi:MAG: hypothetical protein JWO07_333 [Candidatus Saccharibacteria bacterium]|nr:hypothetical protein [Candidatus Saccharibacteria bacterium]
MFSQRIRSMQKRTWIDELQSEERTDAEKSVVLLCTGVIVVLSALIGVVRTEATAVNLSVMGAIGLAGLAALIYGVHDLREAHTAYKHLQELQRQAVEANLCTTKEVCLQQMDMDEIERHVPPNLVDAVPRSKRAA